MYVAIKLSIKEVFDSALKSTATKAVDGGVRSAVEAQKGFDTKKAEDLRIELTVIASVSVDDKAKPTSMKAVVGIDGMLLGGKGGAQAFKATGNGTIKEGLNPKKLDQDVKALLDSVVGDLMKNKVIPAMLKMAP